MRNFMLLFSLFVLFVVDTQARTIMWEGNAEYYNFSLIELTIYENMDDSIFSRLISLSYPEDKIEMPAFAIRLSPNGIKEITILGRYGTWLPLSFYNRICSALINQKQYPWIIGGNAGRRTLDYYQNDSLMKSTAKPKTMKEIFIDELTAQMNSEKSYEFECYTFVLRYPSPGLGDNIGIVDNVCPTREELILNRKMFIDNWLSQKISDINENGIKDSDYELFFDREQLSKYKVKETNVILGLPGYRSGD